MSKSKKSWSPVPPYITRSREFNMSEAYRGLGSAELYVLSRLEGEHMGHRGKDNGRLICTYDDFEAYGIRRPSIAPALRKLQSRGLIAITQRGRRDAMHNPHHYRLTYLPTSDGDNLIAPTDEWRRYRAEKPKKQRKRGTTSSSGRVKHVKSPDTKTYPVPDAKTYPEPDTKTYLCDSRNAGYENVSTFYNSIHLSPDAGEAVGVQGKPEVAVEPMLTGLLEWTTPTLTEIAYTDELRELYRCEMLPAIDLLKLSVATSCIDLSLTKRSN
jgi:hypothetical protein